EMLVGEPPFRGRTGAAIVLRHLRDPIPRPSAGRPDVPETLDDVVARALAKEPVNRFASAGDLALALDQALLPGRQAVSAFVRSRQVVEAAGTSSVATSNPDRFVAVLPFENMSADPENEYFSDGVHEEIIAQLAKIRGLKVISRSSVMRY